MQGFDLKKVSLNITLNLFKLWTIKCVNKYMQQQFDYISLITRENC